MGLEDVGEVIPTRGVGGRKKRGKLLNRCLSCEITPSAENLKIFFRGRINNIISECPPDLSCDHISARGTAVKRGRAMHSKHMRCSGELRHRQRGF